MTSRENLCIHYLHRKAFKLKFYKSVPSMKASPSQPAVSILVQAQQARIMT